MIKLQTDKFSKGRKIGLCIIIALFAASLLVSTTVGKGPGRGHLSDTEQCIDCHGTNLKLIHVQSSTGLTGCNICHSGGRFLYEYLQGADFDCDSCHTSSGEPVGYHKNMVAKHTSEETECTQCHSTDLPEAHEGLDEHCFKCHINPLIELPNNADCTSCHDESDFNPTLNQDPHKGVESHDECASCHLVL